MKKSAVFLLAVLFAAALTGCGPYKNYAGTYTRSTSSAEFTVTLGASGDFKWEREVKNPLPYDPDNNDNFNIREGTYSVENGQIKIKFSYYDEIRRETVNGTATATLSGKKLVIKDDDQIKGTYSKR